MQSRLVQIENSTVEKLQRNAEMLNELTEENHSLRKQLSLAQMKIAELEELLKNAGQMGSPGTEAERVGSAYLQQSRQSGSSVPRGLLKSVKTGDAELNAVAFGREYIATASNDKLVQLWDPRSLELRSSLSGSAQAVLCCDFSEDGTMVLGAGNDCACRIWSLPQCRLRHTLTGHTGKISGAQFSSDSALAVTGSHDRLIKVWDLNRGYCLFSMPCMSICNDVKFVFGNQGVVSAHFDGSLKTWDLRAKDKVDDWKLHSQQITSISVTVDGLRALTASRDNTMKFVEFKSKNEVATFQHPEYKSALNWGRACISPNAEYVAAGSASGKVFVWSVNGARFVKTLEDGHKKTVAEVRWAPDGSRMSSVALDGTLALWD
jgi:autophagy-related protein 16